MKIDKGIQLVFWYVVLAATCLAMVVGMCSCNSQKKAYRKAYKMVHKADGISKPGTIDGFRSIYPLNQVKNDTISSIDTVYSDSIQYQQIEVPCPGGDTIKVNAPCKCSNKIIKTTHTVTNWFEDSSKIWKANHIADSVGKENVKQKDDLIKTKDQLSEAEKANRKKGWIIAGIILVIGAYLFFKYKTAFIGFIKGLIK